MMYPLPPGNHIPRRLPIAAATKRCTGLGASHRRMRLQTWRGERAEQLIDPSVLLLCHGAGGALPECPEGGDIGAQQKGGLGAWKLVVQHVPQGLHQYCSC